MGDVTDRMAPRSKSTLGRMPASSANSKQNEPPPADLKMILNEVEPLKGSANFSPREVDEIMQSTAKMVGDTNVDWLKRLNMLKTFRSLCCDPTHHIQITNYLRYLMVPLQSSVKDLRSQVGREACLTVAYLAAELGVKAECFIEPMLPTLFSLLVANAKIVSVTGASTINLIYEYVPSFRLLPPLQTQMMSKSKDVRRAVCSVLKIILETWPTATIQRNTNAVTEVMKKGLTDADADARQTARETFPAFQKVFPGNAKTILDSLEPLQQRQLQASLSAQPPRQVQTQASKPVFSQQPQPQPSNPTGSLSRQGSLIKKTSIPVFTARVSPSKAGTPPSQGRSASAIDLQAVNKAKQNNFSTMSSRAPLKTMGRTHSSLTSPVTPKYSLPSSSNTSPTHIPLSSTGGGTLDRSRTRSKVSKISQSQPGSRSNSPSSRFAYATYTSPYAQGEAPSFVGAPRGVRKLSTPSSGENPTYLPTSSIGRGVRRVSNSSNSSSRETSPQGRILPHSLRSRSVSNSPQVPLSVVSANSSTAKMLMASREAESALRDALRRRELSELDYSGNQSDSEDSMSSHSHRSYGRSETFSPPSHNRHLFAEDNMEELLNKCGSAKWSERKEGLCGLNNYLQRYGSIPPQYFNRIGQTFCRIFMDAHTKVLSLFLDVLHAVLLRHARDLVDFTTILLNRVLTKLGSDLLTSVHTKLMTTLDIIIKEMPPDLQFSAVAHYLCDPTQTPNSRSRNSALLHLFNLSAISFPVKLNELAGLVDKLLDWSADMRSQELRRTSQEVLRALFDMTAPQMARVLGQLPHHKQDQAKAILENHNRSQPDTPQRGEDTVDIGWNSITSDIQSLRLSENHTESDMLRLLSRMAVMLPSERTALIDELQSTMKDTKDEVIIQCHKELLKILFNALTSPKSTAQEKARCFACLEDLCNRGGLADCLAEYTELFIVRVTEVQSTEHPRDVTKWAEACALSLAANFPAETVARAVCPIVLNKDFPINQLAIKMLQRLTETCELSKLRALLPDIMNALVSAYDHPDSAVRKSAVFAIVALHPKIGAELDPYLSSLSGSKLKLLQLYIQRAQNTNSNNMTS